MPVEKGKESTLLARSCTSTYVLAGILSAIPIVPAAIAGVRYGNWGLLIMWLLFGGLVFLWIGTFKLEIKNGNLAYRTLFGGTKKIALDDIRLANTDIGPSAPLAPFYRLILQPSDTTKAPLVINMKVFSRKDLNRVFDILGAKQMERGISLIRTKRGSRVSDDT